ncbi:hypothetical protein AURDEDRAFT_164562 [Auricularia subglabra TFB-10046 SS5]|nr:hypothetical protein AURDEDRAFT_164562 [Auricularia subglabra TFB-10046 SS5]
MRPRPQDQPPPLYQAAQATEATTHAQQTPTTQQTFRPPPRGYFERLPVASHFVVLKARQERQCRCQTAALLRPRAHTPILSAGAQHSLPLRQVARPRRLTEEK